MFSVPPLYTPLNSNLFLTPPTQDPTLEGERILHELEVLSPADLLDQLLGTTLSCALQLLASSTGARVEAVADVALKYQRCEGQDVAADVSGEQDRRASGSGGRHGTEISKVRVAGCGC